MNWTRDFRVTSQFYIRVGDKDYRLSNLAQMSCKYCEILRGSLSNYRTVYAKKEDKAFKRSDNERSGDPSSAAGIWTHK
jgi:hypothetical protein